MSVNSAGLLTGTGIGSATISATMNGITGTLSVSTTSAVLTAINLTPASTTLALGVQQQFVATGSYSDGSSATITSQVHWASSSTSIATIGSTGLASTIATGSTQISASLNGISQQTTLTVGAAVLQSISVQAATSSFSLGFSDQLTATGTYSNGATANLTGSVTWSSSNATSGVVSASGLATGVTAGSFNARATLNGIVGSQAITVNSAVLQSISISPANSLVLLVLSSPLTYTATGTFSDGSTQILTGVHWAILSGISLGSISQSGAFSPLGLGLGTISASLNGITGTTNFTVVSVL
jgi:hypothetical protein